MTGLNDESIREHWLEYKGRQVGFVLNGEGQEGKIYVTERTQFFRFKDRSGFSISKAILDMLRQAEIEIVRIVFRRPDGTTAVYICSLGKWLKEGETNYYKILDEQLFIPMEKFDKVCE